MTVDERSVRQADGDRRQPERGSPPHRESDPAEDEQEERRDAELHDVGEHLGAARSSGEEELQRPRLQRRVGERVRPASREEPFALVHEAEEVARVRAAVDGRDHPGGGQDRQPDAGERRTEGVPHSGRYRRRKGDG